MYLRRSDPNLAGTQCTFKNGTHHCTKYARFAVSHEIGEGKLSTGHGYCATHTAQECVNTWQTHGKAAIVQEIPGMWREKFQ